MIIDVGVNRVGTHLIDDVDSQDVEKVAGFHTVTFHTVCRSNVKNWSNFISQ